MSMADMTAKGQLPARVATTAYLPGMEWNGMGWSKCGWVPALSCTMLNLLRARCAVVLQDFCKDHPKGFSFFLAYAP